MSNLRRLTWADFDRAVERLASDLRHVRKVASGVYGVPRGGLPLAVALSHRMKLPLLAEPHGLMIWVDDIVDTGRTIGAVKGAMACAAWFTRQPRLDVFAAQVCVGDEWLVFPWEAATSAVAEKRAYASSRA